MLTVWMLISQNLVQKNDGRYFQGKLLAEVSELVRSSVKRLMETRNISEEEAEKEIKSAIMNEKDDNFDKIMKLIEAVPACVKAVLAEKAMSGVSALVQFSCGGICSVQ